MSFSRWKHAREETPSDEECSAVDRLLNEGEKHLLDAVDDDISLRSAATRSRLTFDRLNEHELGSFPELWESQSAVHVYLIIRNYALRKWVANPLEELTYCDLRSEVPPPFNTDEQFIARIHAYLQRYGFINVGRYARSSLVPKLEHWKQRRIVVIGAGLAGIAAATQLASFGFKVTIVEGRDRIGGRVATISLHDKNMEIGGDTIASFKTNPLSFLVQQLPVEPVQVNECFSLYDNGKLVDDRRDRLIERCYKEFQQAIEHISATRNTNGLGDRVMSRQDAFDSLMNQKEHQTMKLHLEYWIVYNELVQSREKHFKEIQVYERILKSLEEQLAKTAPDAQADAQGVANPDATRRSDDVKRRCIRRDFSLALQRFEKEMAALENLEITLANYKKEQPRREFVFGAPLRNVQLGSNVVPKPTQYGTNVRLREGVYTLMTKLVEKRGLDIKLSRKVSRITYNERGVLVTATNSADETENFEAELCVCTLPLGVLKKSLESSESSTNAPVFVPPLPDKTASAIRNMGYGLINKVIMTFERPFWENNNQFYFGHVSPSTESRGEFVLFSSIPDTTVLTTYLVGDSAGLVVPDETIVRKAMAVLASIFGAVVPRSPKEATVTKWQSDEFSYGAFSYFGMDTKPEDYDTLGEPLKCDVKDPSTGSVVRSLERIYFAGEHTSRAYPGSMEGAWLSGIRVAAGIADKVLGCPYADNSEDIVASDDETPQATEEEETENKKPDDTSTADDVAAMPNLVEQLF